MANLTNSHSLTAFQRNARGFIEGLNETREPLLLMVNGSVQAVVVDPQTYQEIEQEMGLLAAIAEGEADIQAERVRPMEELLQEMKERYGF